MSVTKGSPKSLSKNVKLRCVYQIIILILIFNFNFYFRFKTKKKSKTRFSECSIFFTLFIWKIKSD